MFVLAENIQAPCSMVGWNASLGLFTKRTFFYVSVRFAISNSDKNFIFLPQSSKMCFNALL